MKLRIIQFFRPQLQAANLQPVQITELEAEFGKIDGQKASPIRYIRSQQEKQAKLAAEVVQDNGKYIFFSNNNNRRKVNYINTFPVMNQIYDIKYV